MNDVHIEKVRSLRYWRVVVRPTTFVERRVENLLDLPRIIEACAVRLQGWDYSHIGSKIDPEVGPDWVSQSVDWDNYVEYWRFYQSGQFIHLDGFKED